MIPPIQPRVTLTRPGVQSREPVRCDKVLVVEDDPSSRRALTMLLRLKGFDTEYANSVSDAMRLLEWNPGCLLLDLMLPDGNGAAILEHVRTQGLPIRVAITTGASEWRAMLGNGRLQPDAMFTKPLDFERVVEWLKMGVDDC